MAIKFGKAPKASAGELEKGAHLVAQFADVDMAERLGGASEAPADHCPHQVFTVTVKDVVKSKDLSKAKAVGWRYLVAGGSGQESLAAEVYHDKAGKKHEFAEVNQGPFVKGTFSAVKKLEKQVKGNYTVSLLRVPGLFVEAIWLKGKKKSDDLVVPIPPTHHDLKAGKRYSVAEFVEALTAAGKERLALDDAAG